VKIFADLGLRDDGKSSIVVVDECMLLVAIKLSYAALLINNISEDDALNFFLTFSLVVLD
jgi:hypothetical protein